MSKYKVCVYAICKNEEQFVNRWMNSMQEADLVIVTDTGSTDKTVMRLRERGATVYEETIQPWRFDVARNISMSYIPDDVDICVCTDLDELFDAGWREKLEQAWKQSHTRAQYPYIWAFDELENPNIVFKREKIHQRQNFKWVHPVHEVLEYEGNGREVIVEIEDMTLKHYPDASKSRAQYLPLLELSAKENPLDSQTMFWLGREYMYHRQFLNCINTLKHYLTLETATWDEERSAAMRCIAASYVKLKQVGVAKSWLYQAIAQCPRARESYLELAIIGYEQKDWPLVLLMTSEGLKIKEKSDSYLVTKQAYSYFLDDYAAIACYQLGLYERAYEHAKAALSYEPTHKRLNENLKAIERKYREES